MANGVGAAGVPILLPRFTTLGAVVYLPVMPNVFMIAVSLPFEPGVIGFAGAMLAGNLFLLGRDARRLMPLLSDARPAELRPAVAGRSLQHALYGSSLAAAFFVGFHIVLHVWRH